MLSKKRNSIVKIVITILIGLFFVVGFIGYRSNVKAKKIITIGEGNTTEQKVLGELLAVLIENKTDIKVKRKTNIKGPNLTFMALKNGEIDGYVDNTENIYKNVMNKKNMDNEYEIYNESKKYLDSKFKLKILRPFAEISPYVLVTTQSMSDKYNINTIEDLSNNSDKLKLGCYEEFRRYKEGFKGLNETYKFKFKKVENINSSNIYKDLTTNKVNVICVKYDDGRTIKNSLKVLEDNKNFFKRYLIIPILKQEVLKSNTNLDHTINKLTNCLTSKDIRELVYRVDVLKESPQEAAIIFLEDNDFVKLK